MGSFRLLFDGRSTREAAQNDGAASCAMGLLWQHIELGAHDEGLPASLDDLPEIVRSALIAPETRPRCDRVGDGAILNLRGPAGATDPGSDRLVSIRLWVDDCSAISVSRRPLAATDTVEAAMRAGELSDPGDLVASFARSISAGLDPLVAQLGDDLDTCESDVDAGQGAALRGTIAAARSEAIAYRRFVAPNRDALVTLAGLRVPWLAEDDRLHIREAADRFARMAEELEAIRERSALLHELILDLRSEQVEQRNLQIGVIAFIFLPLTFITGLLGMNVEGIPFAREPWAFWGVVAFCALIGLIVLGWFSRRHWLAR